METLKKIFRKINSLPKWLRWTLVLPSSLLLSSFFWVYYFTLISSPNLVSAMSISEYHKTGAALALIAGFIFVLIGTIIAPSYKPQVSVFLIILIPALIITILTLTKVNANSFTALIDAMTALVGGIICDKFTKTYRYFI